ncbi:MAG TPA: hypothetical protein VIJ37_07020 [Steroidobacteraceae bacterium]
MTDNFIAPTERPDDILAFNREDFAVLARDFRMQMNDRLDRILAGGIIAGLMIGWGLISLADARGWPGVMQPVFFAVGWGIALIPAGIGWIRRMRTVNALGLVCLGCGKPLVDTWRFKGCGEEVLATGECPSCSHAIFPGKP